MGVTVQKYGGTSVADPSRIAVVADRILGSRQAGDDVVVVVSAMGQTTNTLLGLAAEVSDRPHLREMDMLLTAGERITMALLAMALHDRGAPAVSFTGSQAGIHTTSSHGEARITRITGERVREALEDDKVVIVAGFQGVDPESKEITTLGRGGSDTTAVALAATLDAEVCEILTDVDGVFTADPRVVPHARKIAAINHGQMLALAEAGADVLMPHSVEFALEHDVTVHVRSSFDDGPGTVVSSATPDLGFAGLALSANDDGPLLTLVGARDWSSISVPGLSPVPGKAGLIRFSVESERADGAMRLLHEQVFAVEAQT